MKVYAVLLAGGKGTRLWPLSTQRCSKSFVPIAGKKPLITQTIERLKGLVDKKNIIIVIDKLQETLLKKFAKGIPERNILVEPFGRSTASAIGLAAINLSAEDIMLVLPTDSFVRNAGGFRKTVKRAINFVSNKKDVLMCIGVKPREASTAYGYIKLKASRAGNIYPVDRFIEKPRKELARKLAKRADYLWNAGMFVFRAKDFLNSVKTHAPLLHTQLGRIKKDKKNIKGAYAKMKNISIDYQIMEKAKNIYCAKGNFPWRDLGSWRSLEALPGKNKKGNIVFGKAGLVDTRDSIVYNTTKKKIGVIGLKDAIVVATEGGMLVCDKRLAESVRKIAE